MSIDVINYDTRRIKTCYNFNHVVTLEEIEKNGYSFKLFDGSTYVNLQEGLAERRYSSNTLQKSNPVNHKSIFEIMDHIRTVRNFQGEIVYKRRHPKEPLRKVFHTSKKRVRNKAKS